MTLTAPAQASGRPEVAATVAGRSIYQVSFYADSGSGWQLVGDRRQRALPGLPDLTRVAAGTAVRFAALAKDNAGHVQSATGATTVAPAADTSATAIVHYHRDDGATRAGACTLGRRRRRRVATDWATPRPPARTDDFGAVFEAPLGDTTPTLSFIIHTPNGSDVPTTQEPGGNQAFVPATTREVWITSGDPTLHTSRP